MPERAVDTLKPVDIQKRQGERVVALADVHGSCTVDIRL
jgi:hypothetical protein